MGNQQVKAKVRNSYSLDSNSFKLQDNSKITPSGSLYRQLNSSLDLKNKNELQSSIIMPSISQSKSIQSKLIAPRPQLDGKQQQAKLQRLTKTNDELRKQLIQINKKLSEQLQKKKKPSLLAQHNKEELTNSLNSKQKSKDKNKFKIIALKKQLQNSYNQIAFYKKQVQGLKKGDVSHTTQVKIQILETKMAKYDLQIDTVSKQVQSLKPVLANQKSVIDEYQKKLNSPQVNEAKQEMQNLKQRLKIIKQNSRNKEKDEKMRHQLQIQLQRKLREVYGEYMPDFVNYSLKPIGKEEELQIKHQESRKKRHWAKNESEFKYVPSALEMQEVEKQWKEQKAQHQRFNNQIDTVLKRRNQLIQLRDLLQIKYAKIQKQIQRLKYKKQRYTAMLAESPEANYLSNSEDSENQEKNRILVYGRSLPNQKQVNDRVFFKGKKLQNMKIVSINVWLMQRQIITALQFYYTNGEEFFVGVRSGQNQQLQEKQVFEMKDEDYLQNVKGIMGKNTFYLQQITFESHKGKSKRIGKQSAKGHSFNMGLTKMQRPICSRVASVFDGNCWRINKLCLEIGQY